MCHAPSLLIKLIMFSAEQTNNKKVVKDCDAALKIQYLAKYAESTGMLMFTQKCMHSRMQLNPLTPIALRETV